MAAEESYSLDTSSLIQAWVRSYPIDVFPSWWQMLDRLIDQGIITCVEEINEEVKKKDDGLHEWLKVRKDKLFVQMQAEIQKAASEVLSNFPTLVDSSKNRSMADPFVIGLAKVNGISVVTEEKNIGNPKKPRIPFVCQQYGIRSISLLELMRELNWTF